jgi:hypothetical protein
MAGLCVPLREIAHPNVRLDRVAYRSIVADCQERGVPEATIMLLCRSLRLRQERVKCRRPSGAARVPDSERDRTVALRGDPRRLQLT